MAELRVAFALFDRDGDGAITAKELRLTMTTLGFPGDDQIVKKMIEKFDYDGELYMLRVKVVVVWPFRMQIFSLRQATPPHVNLQYLGNCMFKFNNIFGHSSIYFYLSSETLIWKIQLLGFV